MIERAYVRSWKNGVKYLAPFFYSIDFRIFAAYFSCYEKSMAYRMLFDFAFVFRVVARGWDSGSFPFIQPSVQVGTAGGGAREFGLVFPQREALDAQRQRRQTDTLCP